MPLILEGLLTTLDADGAVNIAPMGPIVESSMTRLTLRPFQTSRSFANLKRSRQAVFHVTDDVLLLARACIDQFDELPPLHPAAAIEGRILADACRWYALQVETIDNSQPRATIEARVVDSGQQRPFFGFNRAKHAVLEAAILASRVGILSQQEITDQLVPLKVIVEKTGGHDEHLAMSLIEHFIQGSVNVAKPA